MKIALTYNVKLDDSSVEEGVGLKEDIYAEWDDMETIQGVRNALESKHGKGQVTLVEANKDAYEKLRELKPDMVFNIAEGLHGESRESQMPCVFELLGLNYTGSNPLSLALCLNKGRAKEVLTYHNVPNPKFWVIEEGGSLDIIPDNINYPLIVKPLFEGSSKGVRDDCFVQNFDELSKKVSFIRTTYKQSALVEEFLPGREFTVALLGNGDSLKTLPIVEINYGALPVGVNHIYSYEAKWILDRPEDPLDMFICPANLDNELAEKISKVAKDAFNAMGLRDWCRVDVRLDADGEPSIIELNPLPGVLPDPEQNSCFPKAARAEGLDYKGLINSVVDAAKERYKI